MKTLITIAVAVILISGCVTVPTKGEKVVRVEFTTKQNLINLGTTLLGAGLQGLIYYKASEKMGDRLENTLRDEKASMPMVPLAQIPFGFP